MARSARMRVTKSARRDHGPCRACELLDRAQASTQECPE